MHIAHWYIAHVKWVKHTGLASVGHSHDRFVIIITPTTVTDVARGGSN